MKLTFDIQCGEKTCYKEQNVSCQFIRVRKFGTIYYCHLFGPIDEQGRHLELQEFHGWLQRWPECIEATKKELK